MFFHFAETGFNSFVTSKRSSKSEVNSEEERHNIATLSHYLKKYDTTAE